MHRTKFGGPAGASAQPPRAMGAVRAKAESARAMLEPFRPRCIPRAYPFPSSGAARFSLTHWDSRWRCSRRPAGARGKARELRPSTRAPSPRPSGPSRKASAGALVPRAGSGWIALFAGDQSAWEVVGSPAGVALEDGVLAFTSAGGDGYVRTTADFQDFRLRLDFKIARMANSGVFLRAARDGSDPAYSGAELQILDDFNWEQVTGRALEPFQFTGGLYGSLPPAEPALRQLGEWNTYAIEYRGSRFFAELNGRVIHDLDTEMAPGKPFRERAPRGFIGLQRHAAPRQVGEAPYAWFRNVFVQPL